MLTRLVAGENLEGKRRVRFYTRERKKKKNFFFKEFL